MLKIPRKSSTDIRKQTRTSLLPMPQKLFVNLTQLARDKAVKLRLDRELKEKQLLKEAYLAQALDREKTKHQEQNARIGILVLPFYAGLVNQQGSHQEIKTRNPSKQGSNCCI
jgi:hypothetical protein